MAKKEDLKALKQKVLADCSPDVAFWACNGAILRNMSELVSTVENLESGAFEYHVNEEKNDFAIWVGDVLGDETLAKKLKRIKKQEKTVETIKDRIKQLKKA